MKYGNVISMLAFLGLELLHHLAQHELEGLDR
jgi:hypothetical protein